MSDEFGAINVKADREHNDSCPSSRRPIDADQHEAWVCLSKADDSVPRLNQKFFSEVFPKMPFGEVQELVRRLEINPDQAMISSGFLSHASYPLHFLCQYAEPASKSHLLLLKAVIRAYPDAAQYPDASHERLLPLQLLCRYSSRASEYNVKMLKVVLQAHPAAVQEQHRRSIQELQATAPFHSSSRSLSSLCSPSHAHASLPPSASASSLPAQALSFPSAASLASSASSSSLASDSSRPSVELQVDSRPAPVDAETQGHRRTMVMLLLQTRIHLYTWANMDPFGARSPSSTPRATPSEARPSSSALPVACQPLLRDTRTASA